MTTLELEKKWKKKIDVLLQTKDVIPEIDVKKLLKENYFELSCDIDTVLQISGEKISLIFFVTKMINYAINHMPRVGGGQTGFPKMLPGLDYYDNRRDRHNSTDLAKYQGTFGSWRNDN